MLAINFGVFGFQRSELGGLRITGRHPPRGVAEAILVASISAESGGRLVGKSCVAAVGAE